VNVDDRSLQVVPFAVSRAPRITTEGITTLAWEYGGRLHRDLRFTAGALVERPPLARITPPERPTFAQLPAHLRPEAMSRARDTEDGLNKCAAFAAWRGLGAKKARAVRGVTGVRGHNHTEPLNRPGPPRLFGRGVS
jgi:hypothetical protein